MNINAYLQSMNIDLWRYWENEVKNSNCKICEEEGLDIAIWRVYVEGKGFVAACKKCFKKELEAIK